MVMWPDTSFTSSTTKRPMTTKVWSSRHWQPHRLTHCFPAAIWPLNQSSTVATLCCIIGSTSRMRMARTSAQSSFATLSIF